MNSSQNLNINSYNNSTILVSIIVITKNPNLTWLQESLKSISVQKYKNIEVVLVDASDIEIKLSIQKLLSITIKEPMKASFYDQQSTGLWLAFDEGFKQASGDIISVLNSDDYLFDSHVIQSIVDEFSINKVDYTYGQSLRVDRNGAELYKQRPPSFGCSFFVDFMVFVISHHTLYFKKDVLNTIPFAIGVVEDGLDLIFIRNLLKSHYIGSYIRHKIACFRLHDENYSNSSSYAMAASLFQRWSNIPKSFYFPIKLFVVVCNPKYLFYLIKRSLKIY